MSLFNVFSSKLQGQLNTDEAPESCQLTLMAHQRAQLELADGQVIPFSWSRGRDGLWISAEGKTFLFQLATDNDDDASEDALLSPMPAKVIDLLVTDGEAVEEHQTLLILGAMKMEIPIKSPRAGTIKKICVHNDEQVQSGMTLIELDQE